jgi:hypothetical protein
VPTKGISVIMLISDYLSCLVYWLGVTLGVLS